MGKGGSLEEIGKGLTGCGCGLFLLGLCLLLPLVGFGGCGLLLLGM